MVAIAVATGGNSKFEKKEGFRPTKGFFQPTNCCCHRRQFKIRKKEGELGFRFNFSLTKVHTRPDQGEKKEKKKKRRRRRNDLHGVRKVL